MAPFVIFSLPRSRSYWTAQFLSYKDWTCGHDEARHARGVDDVKSWLAQDCVGTAETAAGPFWRLLLSLRPDIKVVVIRRPVADVVGSIMATGIQFDRATLTMRMEKLDRKLDQIERRVPGVMSIQFADLANEHTCAALFEHCLPYKHDPHWWRLMSRQNLQVNLRALIRYQIAHSAQMKRAASICAQETRSVLWRGSRDVATDGMTFQEEPFETVWREAKRLFSEHCAVVGESADQFTRKNVTLLRKLDKIGAMQIMTARANGRMFGYLVTLLGPSLEDENTRVAQQTAFYASPDACGVGIRLQLASVRALEARGGEWDVLQRAGVRGSGPRLGEIYRRMGAVPHGHLWKLSLKAA